MLAKRNILDFIKTLNRERGVTVMLTSHDMDELEQLAGRIVLIDRGRIAYDGDFVELRRRFGDRRHLTIETGAAEPAPPHGRPVHRQRMATATTSPSTPPAPRLPHCCSRSSTQTPSTTWNPTVPASTT